MGSSSCLPNDNKSWYTTCLELKCQVQNHWQCSSDWHQISQQWTDYDHFSIGISIKVTSPDVKCTALALHQVMHSLWLIHHCHLHLSHKHPHWVHNHWQNESAAPSTSTSPNDAPMTMTSPLASPSRTQTPTSIMQLSISQSLVPSGWRSPNDVPTVHHWHLIPTCKYQHGVGSHQQARVHLWAVACHQAMCPLQLFCHCHFHWDHVHQHWVHNLWQVKVQLRVSPEHPVTCLIDPSSVGFSIAVSSTSVKCAVVDGSKCGSLQHQTSQWCAIIVDHSSISSTIWITSTNADCLTIDWSKCGLQQQ